MSEPDAMLFASHDLAARTPGQAAAAPPGGGPEAGPTTRARFLTVRTSPQFPQVFTSALRPRPHIGQRTQSISRSTSQRVAPDGYTSACAMQYGSPAGKIGWPDSSRLAGRL